jgi:hypothetical protein
MKALIVSLFFNTKYISFMGMTKTLTVLISILVCLTSTSTAQKGSLVIKRNNKTMFRYWAGKEIAFQTPDKAWHKGTISRLTVDSFYIKPIKVVYHMMGTDTIRYNTEGYRHADIATVPKRGMLIDNVNGGFAINRSGGHVHFFWIKGGLLFKLGAGMYAGVRLGNTIGNEFNWKKERGALLSAAAVYAFGVLLRKLYKPVYVIGKKYRYQYIDFSD